MAAAHRVHLQPQGWHFDASEDETLLQAALRARVRLPSSCRNGTCRACCCRLLEGRVAYTVEWPGLTREEQAEGWVLPCVACARAGIILDTPGALPLDASKPPTQTA